MCRQKTKDMEQNPKIPTHKNAHVPNIQKVYIGGDISCVVIRLIKNSISVISVMLVVFHRYVNNRITNCSCIGAVIDK